MRVLKAVGQAACFVAKGASFFQPSRKVTPRAVLFTLRRVFLGGRISRPSEFTSVERCLSTTCEGSAEAFLHWDKLSGASFFRPRQMVLPRAVLFTLRRVFLGGRISLPAEFSSVEACLSTTPACSAEAFFHCGKPSGGELVFFYAWFSDTFEFRNSASVAGSSVPTRRAPRFVFSMTQSRPLMFQTQPPRALI